MISLISELNQRLERVFFNFIESFQSFLNDIYIFFKVPQNERISFLLQLYTAFKAGLPMSRILRTLSETWRGGLKPYIENIYRSVYRGKGLARSLDALPESIYPRVIREIIRIGEETGRLDQALYQAYKLMELKRDLWWGIVSSLIYPLVAILSGIGALVIFNSVFFPVMIEVYRSLDVPLPAITRFIIKVNNLLSFSTLKWFLILGLILSIPCIYYRDRLGEFLSRVILITPGLGKLYRIYLLSLFFRTLHISLQAGLSLSETLKLISELFPRSLKEVVLYIYDRIREGESLHKAMRDLKWIFSNLAINMVRTFEETGDDSVIDRVAYLMEFEYQIALKELLKLIEPVTMVIIGGFALFITVGVFAPLINLLRI